MQAGTRGGARRRVGRADAERHCADERVVRLILPELNVVSAEPEVVVEVTEAASDEARRSSGACSSRWSTSAIVIRTVADHAQLFVQTVLTTSQSSTAARGPLPVTRAVSPARRRRAPSSPPAGAPASSSRSRPRRRSRSTAGRRDRRRRRRALAPPATRARQVERAERERIPAATRRSGRAPRRPDPSVLRSLTGPRTTLRTVSSTTSPSETAGTASAVSGPFCGTKAGE
jgi:hypothetical protein